MNGDELRAETLAIVDQRIKDLEKLLDATTQVADRRVVRQEIRVVRDLRATLAAR